MENAQQEEIVNMLRVVYVINFPCTDLFRDILRHHVTEIQMTGRLLEEETPKNLLKRNLGTGPKEILYPQNGCFTSDYTSLDLSALYCLIRNVSGIPAHHKGWGRSPEQSDRSVSANIERLRKIRNVYTAHSACKTLKEDEFQTLWNKIEASIEELEKSLPGKSTKYKDEVTKWKTCPFDSTLPHEKIIILQQIISETKDDEIQNRQGKQIDRLLSTIDAFEETLQSPVSLLIGKTKVILLQHRDSKTYVRTEAVNITMKTLEEQHIAILIGKPGDGKTTTAYQVMYEISNKPETQNLDCLKTIKQKRAVIIQSPDEWQKYIDPLEEFIVYFDDCFGSTNFNSEAAARWKSSLDSIYASAKKGNIFVLIGLQSSILEKLKESPSCHKLFSEEFVVDASYLKENEKRDLIDAYEQDYIKRKNRKVQSPVKAFKQSSLNVLSEKDKSKIIASMTTYGFPLACRLFFDRERFHDLGYKFFSKPGKELLDEIETMRKGKRVTYIVLAYVLINGKINPYALEEKLLTDICTKLRHPQGSESKVDILDAVDELTKPYLEKDSSTGEYVLSHTAVLDNVLLSFGRVAPEIVLRRCSRRCLYELIRTPKTVHNNMELAIPSNCFQLLAERLLQVHSSKKGSIKNYINIAIDIVWHPATHDAEFVDVLLRLKQLRENNNLLRALWYVFPGSTTSVMLDKMLAMYGLDEDIHTHLVPKRDKLKDKENTLAVEKKSEKGQTLSKVMSCISQCVDNYEGNLHIICCLKYIGKDRRLYQLLDSHVKHSPGGMTLLHCSILLGWEDVVDEILKIHTPTATENHWTCLHFSAYIGNCPMLQKFVELGQDIEANTAEGFSVLQTCFIGMRYGSGETNWPLFSVSEKDRFQMTLTFPAEDSYEAVLRYIFQCKPLSFIKEIENKIDDFGNNILYYLVIQDYSNILEFFCRQNEDVVLERTSSILPTLLHLAVYLGRSLITKQLWSDAVRPFDSDMSLEETLKLGQEFINKRVEFSRLNRIKKPLWCWNDAHEEMIGIPFKTIAGIDVILGNINDFFDIKNFLQSQGIRNINSEPQPTVL